MPMRSKRYNSACLNLLENMQQRVNQVHTGTKKFLKTSFALLLFMAGMSWLPVTAQTTQQWMAVSLPSPHGANGAVVAGDQLNYTIYVMNTGTTTVNVTVVDTFPNYTISYNGAPGADIAVSGGYTIATWNNLQPLAPGDVTSVTISLKAAANLSGVSYITNTGYVDNGDGTGFHSTGSASSANPGTPGPDNGPPSTKVEVDNGQNGVAWMTDSYTGTGPNGSIASTDIITYEIYIKNTGSVALTNVVVTDFVPQATTFVRATNGVTPDGTNKLKWTIGSIAPGDKAQIEVQVAVAGDLTGVSAITNTATVDLNNGKDPINALPSLPGDPDNPDPSHTVGPATSIPVVSQISFVNWEVALDVNGNELTEIGPGETIYYVIYAKNTGNVAISELAVSGAVPDGTKFSAVHDLGAWNGLAGTGGTLDWTVFNLTAGNTATLHFEVTVNDKLDALKNIIANANARTVDTTVQSSHCEPGTPGCDGTGNTTVKIAGSAPGFFVTNVVTPNGDGKNDYFVVRGLAAGNTNNPNATAHAKLYIFNRWGGTVYQSLDYQNNWNASGLSEGTYYYRLEVTQDDGTMQTLKGWVMIIR